eukprot:14922908-Heterocapsa_arctica.AAC.1
MDHRVSLIDGRCARDDGMRVLGRPVPASSDPLVALVKTVLPCGCMARVTCYSVNLLTGSEAVTMLVVCPRRP